MSVLPPAPNGTSTVTGRVGQSAAGGGRDSAVHAAMTAVAAIRSRRLCIGCPLRNLVGFRQRRDLGPQRRERRGAVDTFGLDLVEPRLLQRGCLVLDLGHELR